MIRFSQNDESYKPTDPRARQTPGTKSMKKITGRHIIIELLKNSDKEDILKVAMEKGIT